MGTYINALKKYEKELDIEKKGLTITVSGKSGTGKTTIAKSIAEALNLKYINVGDIFRQVASEEGVDLADFSDIRDKNLDFKADKKTLELAKEGNVVLNGRLTGWVAGDLADVKVFVTADSELIAERVAKRDDITVETAKQHIATRDENDSRIYSELYDIDVTDTSIYDLIINNSRLSFEQAKIVPVQKVKELLNIT